MEKCCMNVIRRLLFMLLLIPFGTLYAQTDDTQGDIDIFGSAFEAAYVFNQAATGGSLTALEDNVYELQLTGIPAELDIMKVTPPGLLTYVTENLAQDWTNAIQNASDDTVTQVLAELDINGDTVVMALQSASYDVATETMTYTGEVVQYIPFAANQEFNLANATADLEKADIPTTFEAVTLTISASAQFWGSLQGGANFRLAAIRSNDHPQCASVRDILAELTSTLDDVRNSEADAATIATLRQQINYAESWLEANCS
jgi:hypothetical protein